MEGRIRKVVLEFEGESTPELTSTLYFCPFFGRTIRSIRGRTTPSRSGVGTFQWTSAVIALSVAFLRARYAETIGAVANEWTEKAAIQGRSGSFAASLDFALSKGPLWLQEMFGIDSNGYATGRRIFTRVNSEGKRVGPTTVVVNRAYIEPQGIEILLNKKLLSTSDELHDLLVKLHPEGTIAPVENKTPVLNESTLNTDWDIDSAILSYGNKTSCISRSVTMLDDIVVHVLASKSFLKIDDIASYLLRTQLFWANDGIINDSISRLIRRGILRRKEDNIILNNYWFQNYSRFVEAASDVGREFRHFQLDRKRGICKLSTTLQFKSLGEYSSFMPVIVDKVIQEFTAGNTSGYELINPWWKPIKSTDDTENTIRKGSITYVPSQNHSTKEWIFGLYKNCLSDLNEFVSDSFFGYLWIYEDLLIHQYLTLEVQSEIATFSSERKQGNPANSNAWKKQLLSKLSPVTMRIKVVPGLCAALGTVVS